MTHYTVKMMHDSRVILAWGSPWPPARIDIIQCKEYHALDVAGDRVHLLVGHGWTIEDPHKTADLAWRKLSPLSYENIKRESITGPDTEPTESTQPKQLHLGL